MLRGRSGRETCYGDLRISTRAERGAQADEVVGDTPQLRDVDLAAPNDLMMCRAEMNDIPV